jgi:hypothetical protein
MNLKKLAVISALAVALVLGLMVFSSNKVFASSTLTVGNATSGSCIHTFTTIQSAVTAASPGDTIQVCPGTYNELVVVDKTLTILGAQAGVDARTRSVPLTSESVVSNGDGDFQIEADKVVIDGFTIQGVTNDPNVVGHGLVAGIWMNPGEFAPDHGGAKIRNNIIQNNIIGIELDNDGTFQAKVERNLIQNNNASGPDGGTGIDTNFRLINAVIDSNKIAGNINSGINNIFASGSTTLTVSNNEFAANRRAIGWGSVSTSSITNNNIHNSNDAATADIRIFGGVSGLSITCNNLANGAGRAIRINDAGFGGGPNSSITINNNNISGYPIGLEENLGGYTGGFNSLDATNDWWGSSTGPTIASNPGGTGEPIIDEDGVVKYSPFLTTFSSCAPVPQVGPPTNKDQCKDGGWQTFNVPRKFKNQGDCIQFVNTGK